MKIFFVVNNYYASGNGLSASARRTVRYLREAGEEVRVLSGRNHEAEEPQPDYVLGDFRVPVFDGLVQSHGYKFAKTDFSLIEEAVKWADVVHLEEPFIIQMVTARIAGHLGVPCTATYHLHPENMFCSINLGGWKFLNYNMLRAWRNFVFNFCSDIQCPTENVLERLQKFGFKSRLHLISNGIIPDPIIRSSERSEDPDRPFLVACIGRLAVEKDQPTLLEAMRSPLFMAYHDGQPFNENMFQPCPMLENPQKLRGMIEKTGAHSTDLQSPETVEHLCVKCDAYAACWQGTADRLWTERQEQKTENQEKGA